ncbi:Melatonin receptor type 1A-A [Amphibalanus amphitrite]|uniref:Melatonin receptor type 1A-A n=1 Tax=Amphibalanus amphitrite TaxID=1232801 RepID=A0A6A4VVP7_AMPAM|nr:Melatonin receptor type 1A-A [Amphibalanus amphitrite]
MIVRVVSLSANCPLCSYCPLLGPPNAGKGQYGFGAGGYGYPGYQGVPGYGRYGVHPGSGRESLQKLGQLVGLSAVATVGTLGHVYTVSACVVGDRLRKKDCLAGNFFLVNLSLAMLLVTLLVLPSLSIHMLASADVSAKARRLHEHLVELCGCVSLFALCTVAVESYVRVCHRRLHGRLVGRRCVAAGLLLVWALGGATFGVVLLARAGPHAQTHSLLLAIIIGTATAIAGFLYLLTWRRARHLRRCTCHGRRTRPMPWHVELARANWAVWLSFCAGWLPAAAQRTLGPLLAPLGRPEWVEWLPLAHATLFPALYAVFSEDFRESYSNLARYCCCRMSVHFGRRPRTDLPRPLLSETRKSPMRVHLIPGYDMRTTLSVGDAPSRTSPRASPARSVGSAASSRPAIL